MKTIALTIIMFFAGYSCFSQNIQLDLDKAVNLHFDGKYKKSIRFCKKVIKAEPENETAIKLLAQNVNLINNPNGGIEDYTVTINYLKSKTRDALYLKGISKLKTDKIPEALKDFTDAIKIDKTKPEVFYYRAISKQILNDNNGAIKDCNRAIELNINYAEAFNYRGEIYFSIKKYDESFEDFTKAIFIDKSFKEAYNNRAQVFFVNGKIKEAILDYDKAILIDNTFSKAYFNRSIAKIKINEFDEAIIDLNRVTFLESNNFNAFNSRGITKLMINDYSGAIEDFSSAIDRNPYDEKGYLNRGNLLKQLGKNRLAEKDFIKASSISE